VIDGPVLSALALKKLRDGRLDTRASYAALRIRWTRRGIAECTGCTMPMYLAGRAAWDVAFEGSLRARDRFDDAVRFAEARGLFGELSDVRTIKARVFPKGALRSYPPNVAVSDP